MTTATGLFLWAFSIVFSIVGRLRRRRFSSAIRVSAFGRFAITRNVFAIGANDAAVAFATSARAVFRNGESGRFSLAMVAGVGVEPTIAAPPTRKAVFYQLNYRPQELRSDKDL